MLINKNKHFICISIITIIGIIHYFLTNPLEKSIIYVETDNTERIRRPDKTCIGKSNLGCIGMPSGHSEIVVIICYLLLNLKLIDFKVALAIISLVGLQRIYSQRHTTMQVITGYSIGIIYAILYSQIWNTYNKEAALLISIFIPVILLAILTNNIDKKVNMTPPEWVDKNHMSIIKRKQNAYYINKLIQCMSPIREQKFSLLYSWKQVEQISDSIIQQLDNKKIDIIVGIKSGGAIIAPYFKSKIPNTQMYYIKLKKSVRENNEPNEPEQLFDYIIHNLIKHKISIVEGIDDDISDKNILLLDETIDSGKTILFAKNYLQQTKKVKNVIIAAITVKSDDINKYKPIYYGKEEINVIWPWGYDN